MMMVSTIMAAPSASHSKEEQKKKCYTKGLSIQTTMPRTDRVKPREKKTDRQTDMSMCVGLELIE
jgi:hypothetical protein